MRQAGSKPEPRTITQAHMEEPMTRRHEMTARKDAEAAQCPTSVGKDDGRLAIETVVTYGDGAVIVYPYLTPRDQQWQQPNDLHRDVVEEQRAFAGFMANAAIDQEVRRAALARRREINRRKKQADRDLAILKQWQTARDAAMVALAEAEAENGGRFPVTQCECTGIEEQREAAPEVARA